MDIVQRLSIFYHSFLFLLFHILVAQILFGKYLLCTLIIFNVTPCRGDNDIWSDDGMQSALNLYNEEAGVLRHHSSIAQWNVATDVGNKDKEEEKVSFSNAH